MRRTRQILFTSIFLTWPSVVHADVVWPALYVLDSHFRFWYVVVIGLLLEAGVLRWRLAPSLRKALLISFVVNAFSATVGIYLMAFGMVGWHLIADNFVNGTFALFNRIATMGLMGVGSVFLETLVARVIWKYPLQKSFPVFVLGNILSYTVVAIDLFVFGGWNKEF